MKLSAFAATAALAVFGAGSVYAADLTKPLLTSALENGCAPWLKGGDKTKLGAELLAKGWTKGNDASYGKVGDGGRVSLTLEEKAAPDGAAPGTAAKRMCNVYYNTTAQPRTLVAATDIIGPWANKTLSGAQIKEGDTVQDNDAVHYRVWVTPAMDVMEITYKDQQKMPKSDLVLRVEYR